VSVFAEADIKRLKTGHVLRTHATPEELEAMGIDEADAKLAKAKPLTPGGKAMRRQVEKNTRRANGTATGKSKWTDEARARRTLGLAKSEKAAVDAVLHKLKCDPIEGMVRIARDAEAVASECENPSDKVAAMALAGRLYGELTNYLHAKKKAVEVQVYKKEEAPATLAAGLLGEIYAKTLDVTPEPQPR
jgi:hypothetical protein